MAELVDARDLKSLGAMPRASSILAPGTNYYEGLADFWRIRLTNHSVGSLILISLLIVKRKKTVFFAK
jgi:hypothetical protein